MEDLLSVESKKLSNDQLIELTQFLNTQYRNGTPIVSDDTFDQVYLAELSARFPNHPLLTRPQPEPVSSKGRIAHPAPMLSTEKAYTSDEIESFVKGCQRVASRLGVDLMFRLTPKLDGIAGRYVSASRQLITRGDGLFGNDISHLLAAGLVIKGDAGRDGVGEVVMPLRYFEDNMAGHFAHPRNLIAGAASADQLNEHTEKALKDGAIQLVIYRDLDAPVVDALSLLWNLEALITDIMVGSPYPLDGVVIEVTDERIKAEMGSTGHHHCWQIAKKAVGETALATVTGICWQVGRTGRVSPVIEIEPTRLSGATISRVTGHHAGNVVNQQIGKGAVIEICRSGLVVPRIMRTLTAVRTETPSECPCCGHQLEWDGDFLVCVSPECSAQTETGIIHHFKTIQADLFGPKTVAKLVAGGFDTIEKIYWIEESDLHKLGFGSGQAKNLLDEIERIICEPLPDWRLLASLGIRHLGRGASEKLLRAYPIDRILLLTEENIAEVEGFGSLTAKSITSSLQERSETLAFLLGRGFNLIHSKNNQATGGGSLDGVHIVFTGSMRGSRDEMKADARSKGGNVQSSVNGKTHVLVCGQGVGEKKLAAARDKGVEIITEDEYWQRFCN